MGKKTLTYTGGLIGLYLIVRNYTGSGRVLSSGAAGGVSIIKTLQGR